MKKIIILALTFLILCCGSWYFFIHDTTDRTIYEFQFYQDNEFNNYQKFLLTVLERSIDCKFLKKNVTRSSFWIIDKDKIEEYYENFADMMIVRYASVEYGRTQIADILKSNKVKTLRSDVYQLLQRKFKRYEERTPVAETFKRGIWSNQKLEGLYTDLQIYLCHINSAPYCHPDFLDEELSQTSLSYADTFEYVLSFEIAYLQAQKDAHLLCKELLMYDSGFDTCFAEDLAEFFDYDGRTVIDEMSDKITDEMSDKITDEIDDLHSEEEADCCETPGIIIEDGFFPMHLIVK